VDLIDLQWKYAVEAVIGRYLSNFIVYTYEDRALLQSLFKRFRCDNQIIYKTTHSHELREPPSEVLTAYRACKIGHADVSSVLCLLSSFEKILLCRTRRECEETLKSPQYGGQMPNADAAFTIDAAKITVSQTSQTYFSYGSSKRICRYFDNAATQVSHLTGLLHQKSIELERLKVKMREKQEISTQLQQKQKILVTEIESMEREKRTLSSALRDIEHRIESYQMERSDFEAKAESIRNEIEQLKLKIQRLDKQKVQISERKGTIRTEIETKGKELSQVESEKQELERQIELLTNRAHSVLEELSQMENRNQSKKALMDKLGSKICALDAKIDDVESNLSATEAKASSIGPRSSLELPVDQPRPATLSLQKQWDHIVNKLSRQHVTADQITKLASMLESVRLKYETARTSFAFWNHYLGRLTESLSLRETRLTEFRKVISVESQLYFCYFMSHRGFNGKLVFDHGARTLRLCVQIADRALDRLDGTDIKTLSGGEKSVATTCFLLSLWNSMETPLRCLDEFDVFMDNVNRSTILKILLNFAKTKGLPRSSEDHDADCVHTQYIFITPQVLFLDAEITSDPTVKILRMKDPERTDLAHA
jgi:structural maintenance of chromosomes protein 6